MTPVKDLQNAIVASLQDIPDLVQLIGQADRISGFDIEKGLYRNLREAIQSMLEPSILVVFRGASLAYRGTFQRWRFDFVIVMRAPGEFDLLDGTDGVHPGYFGMYQRIVDGLPTAAEGLRWLDSTIHPLFDPPQVVQFIPGQDDDKTEWWQLNISLFEIGG